jgi:putative transposase
MTCLRRVVPGTTYLLTRRCVQRRDTLVPRGVVPKLLGYCVALAAELLAVQPDPGSRLAPDTFSL